MYLYSVELFVKEDIPSFNCRTRSIKKYDEKKGYYYLSYGKGRISKYTVNSNSGRVRYYFTKEERNKAKEYLLIEYLNSVNKQINDMTKRAKDTKNKLKLTKNIYDIMFKGE